MAANSSCVPRRILRNSGMSPMPSGSRRTTSSVTPGRMVGLIMPTTPRQLENAMRLPPSAIVANHHGGESPIHEQQLAGDEIRILRHQEQDRAREIDREPGAPAQVHDAAGRIEFI